MKKISTSKIVIACTLGFIIVKLIGPNLSSNGKLIEIIIIAAMLLFILIKNMGSDKRKRKGQIVFITGIVFFITVLVVMAILKSSNPNIFAQHKDLAFIIGMADMIIFIIICLYAKSLLESDKKSGLK